MAEAAVASSTWTRVLAVAGVTDGADAAYWRPTVAAGEIGLLEAFARKAESTRAGSAAATSDGLEHFILVCSRPLEELRRNFSNHRGERVDLSLPAFQLSRSALAVQQLEALHDNAEMRGKDVKTGLRAHLPAMNEDAFYLVAYRDYSAFATDTFASEARRTRLGTPKFVERFFAVRVGQSAGVLIPVTASQFQRGWEMLIGRGVSARHFAEGAAESQQDPLAALTRWALSSDQFRSLGAVPLDVRDQAHFDRLTAAGGHTAGATDGAAALPRSLWYTASQPEPSAWDFTPAAIQWRLQRSLERQYSAVGRVVVNVAIIATAIGVARYAFAQASPEPRGRRTRASIRSHCAAVDDRTVPEALFDALVTLSPGSFVSYVTS